MNQPTYVNPMMLLESAERMALQDANEHGDMQLIAHLIRTARAIRRRNLDW